MNASFDFDEVDRLAIGAIGEPGRRVFLVQVERSGQVFTLKVEKQQVAVLVEYLVDALADLARPGHLPEDIELRGPFDVEWVIDSIGVEWDEEADRFVVELDAGPDETGAVATGRFAITREQAAAVSISTTSVLEAGRPPCPLCGFPLDPAGHACPKTNGNRPPQL